MMMPSFNSITSVLFSIRKRNALVLIEKYIMRWNQLKSLHHGLSLSSAETWILRENYFNTMIADGLGPCVTSSSAAMVLTVVYKPLHVFHEQEYQISIPSQCWEKIENENSYFS